MTKRTRCRWIFGEVGRGQSINSCPLHAKPGRSYCVHHERRSRHTRPRADDRARVVEDVGADAELLDRLAERVA